MSEDWKIETVNGKEMIFTNTSVSIVRMGVPDIESYKKIGREWGIDADKRKRRIQLGLLAWILTAAGAFFTFRDANTLAGVEIALFVAFLSLVFREAYRESNFVDSLHKRQWEILASCGYPARRGYDLHQFGFEFEPERWKLIGDKRYIILPKE